MPPAWLAAAWSQAQELFWPGRCALCDAGEVAGPLWLCGPCRAAITLDPGLKCPRCTGPVGEFIDTSNGCPACRGKLNHLAGATRLGHYSGPLRDAVLRAKSLAGELLAGQLGALLAEARGEALLAAGADVVIPVPLHWRRHWRRGYNQSEEVARALARGLGRPCLPRGLVRVRPTPSQSTQSPSQRWDNVKGAFAARLPLSGVRVLLVDDVLTTGATAEAAATALHAGGAAQVHLAALAHR